MKKRGIKKCRIFFGQLLLLVIILSGFAQKSDLKGNIKINSPKASSNLISYNEPNNNYGSLFSSDSESQGDLFQGSGKQEAERGFFDIESFKSGHLDQQDKPMAEPCCDPWCIPDPNCEPIPTEDIPLDGGWEMLLFTLGIGLGLYKLLKLKISVS